ncbi:MAG: hypothetical protein ANIMEMIM_00155 [Candidatus Argoarchaeum ethanivorans]|uniref:Uncharacterized protein n=1 Tax=Candidatus Argoarchaeum ethanivorans TaxID=2608793 RepID=A0A811T9Q2_9EURY|nr:MAG: hypothetical protein ANIMEMIM_00155 [Candidatus Argoarchaeum ethanivorans]
MKQKSTKIETVVIIIAFLILIFCPTANASIGLGISPASITISDAFKGGTYERTITVFNSGDEDGTFAFSGEGECAGWISFYTEDDLTIPVTKIAIPAKDKTKVVVKFDIPKNIANADYTTTVYTHSIPKEEASEGGAVAHAVVRIPLEVLIQVTGTQILKGTVKSITTTDIEIDYPLKIKVEFKNEGNVVAKPKIAVAITKSGELVDSFVHDEAGIKPDCEDMVTVLWNTTEQGTGDYTTDVAVSLGEELLTTKSLPFKILPFGTLTRQGELTSLVTEGEPMISRVIKIFADFENTGKIDSRATFKGEVYRDGEFVDVIESDEMIVEVGETSRLTAYYKILSSGRYVVKGCVLYEGKETGTEEILFDVASTNSKSGTFDIPGFSGSILIIAIMLICFMYKKR